MNLTFGTSQRFARLLPLAALTVVSLASCGKESLQRVSATASGAPTTAIGDAAEPQPVPESAPVPDDAIPGVERGPREALDAVEAVRPEEFRYDPDKSSNEALAYGIAETEASVPVAVAVAAYRVDDVHRELQTAAIRDRYTLLDESHGWPEGVLAGSLDQRPHYMQVSFVAGDYYVTFVASVPSAFGQVEPWARAAAHLLAR